MVAKVISVRATLGATRQVFMVSMGGYDTHAAQDTTHTNLLTQLAAAISFFQTTMDALGTANDVTLFTASDFGRTLIQNGDGSDHGWGSHHFVVGGAVNGQRNLWCVPGPQSERVHRCRQWPIDPHYVSRAIRGDAGKVDGRQRRQSAGDPPEP